MTKKTNLFAQAHLRQNTQTCRLQQKPRADWSRLRKSFKYNDLMALLGQQCRSSQSCNPATCDSNVQSVTLLSTDNDCHGTMRDRVNVRGDRRQARAIETLKLAPDG